MSGLTKLRVIVAGAGAFGSTIALRLAQAGAQVTLADPHLGQGSGASGLAAGMLAPAFESVLDAETHLPFALMLAARDLWRPLAERMGATGLGLSQAGAVWFDLPDAPPRIEALAAALAQIGARTQPAPASAAALTPAGAQSLFCPEDWRLQPRAALATLQAALVGAGGALAAVQVRAFGSGQARLSDGTTLAADRLILATGASGGGLAPELSHLVPIKGQILSYPAQILPPETPSIRCAGGYATGGADGLFVGATMEAGRRDTEVDPAVVARLAALAGRLYPQTLAMTPLAAAGVRAASPDNRPMIGPSQAEGVLLAAGARRNGWLLAPLVAQMLQAYLADQDPGPYASLLTPQRFAAARTH